MTLTLVVLLIIIAGYTAYLIYDEFVSLWIKGKTVLTVRLRKRSFIDQLILAVLVVILYISNRLQNNSATINLLLLILAGLLLLYAFVHTPKARFKETGFLYGFQFIEYDSIKNMRLSKDGVLVIDTDRRRVLLFARKIEDLEQILKLLQEK
jgi:uncharacterized membrane protein YobD (UPF0266 family)